MTPPLSPPTCDMVKDCREPITYIDQDGFAYCTAHGLQRRAHARAALLEVTDLLEDWWRAAGSPVHVTELVLLSARKVLAAGGGG